MAGMGSSRTVLELEDSSRTQNRGLGLDGSASDHRSVINVLNL